MTAIATPTVPGTGTSGRSTPRPIHWTVNRFHEMGERGYFEGRRASLIHGVIVEEGPMNPPHAIAGEHAEEAIRAAFPGWRVRVQKPLVLGLDLDPLPDIAVVVGPASVAAGHPTTAALVVEIADSSLDYDLTTKAELYAMANIPEYWVIEIDGRILHVIRSPALLPGGLAASTYQSHVTFSETQSVSPLALPTALLNVRDLLP